MCVLFDSVNMNIKKVQILTNFLRKMGLCFMQYNKVPLGVQVLAYSHVLRLVYND